MKLLPFFLPESDPKTTLHQSIALQRSRAFAELVSQTTAHPLASTIQNFGIAHQDVFAPLWKQSLVQSIEAKQYSALFYPFTTFLHSDSDVCDMCLLIEQGLLNLQQTQEDSKLMVTVTGIANIVKNLECLGNDEIRRVFVETVLGLIPSLLSRPVDRNRPDSVSVHANSLRLLTCVLECAGALEGKVELVGGSVCYEGQRVSREMRACCVRECDFEVSEVVEASSEEWEEVKEEVSVKPEVKKEVKEGEKKEEVKKEEKGEKVEAKQNTAKKPRRPQVKPEKVVQSGFSDDEEKPRATRRRGKKNSLLTQFVADDKESSNPTPETMTEATTTEATTPVKVTRVAAEEDWDDDWEQAAPQSDVKWTVKEEAKLGASREDTWSDDDEWETVKKDENSGGDWDVEWDQSEEEKPVAQEGVKEEEPEGVTDMPGTQEAETVEEKSEEEKPVTQEGVKEEPEGVKEKEPVEQEAETVEEKSEEVKPVAQEEVEVSATQEETETVEVSATQEETETVKEEKPVTQDSESDEEKPPTESERESPDEKNEATTPTRSPEEETPQNPSDDELPQEKPSEFNAPSLPPVPATFTVTNASPLFPAILRSLLAAVDANACWSDTLSVVRAASQLFHHDVSVMCVVATHILALVATTTLDDESHVLACLKELTADNLVLARGVSDTCVNAVISAVKEKNGMCCGQCVDVVQALYQDWGDDSFVADLAAVYLHAFSNETPTKPLSEENKVFDQTLLKKYVASVGCLQPRHRRVFVGTTGLNVAMVVAQLEPETEEDVATAVSVVALLYDNGEKEKMVDVTVHVCAALRKQASGEGVERMKTLVLAVATEQAKEMKSVLSRMKKSEVKFVQELLRKAIEEKKSEAKKSKRRAAHTPIRLDANRFK